MRDFGRKRIRVNKEHPKYRDFITTALDFVFHVVFSLFFIPLAVALVNASL